MTVDAFEAAGALPPQRVVVTLKGGAGYDAPWVVIHGETAGQVGSVIEELRDSGAFQVVQQAAAEFKAEAPRSHAEAVANIQTSMPGATVIGSYGSGGQELPSQFQGGQQRNCVHGPMKLIQGQYGPFWACERPRGDPAKCKNITVR